MDLLLPTEAAPGRILLVDDQEDNRTVVALEFKRQPFRFTMAGSAQEALDLCESEEFEGILMDVGLPVMDGLEVCRRIRHGRRNARTPVIFLSALRAGDAWITRGLEAGGLDYLVKPHAFPELLAKLRMMVRLSRQERALLAAQRQEALLEVAGGAAHELAQPLASAQILLDQLNVSGSAPTPQQLELLRECLAEVAKVLHQIQNLHSYVTKPYAEGRILDLDLSSRSPQPREG